jgi:hypothetical protein
MTDITATMVSAGVFPSDMVVPGQTWPFDPRGGPVVIYVAPNSPGADNTECEVAYYSGAVQNDGVNGGLLLEDTSNAIPCVKLLSEATGPSQDSGPVYVFDYQDGWQAAADGGVAATNFANCAGQVAWTFKLNGVAN